MQRGTMQPTSALLTYLETAVVDEESDKNDNMDNIKV